MKRTAFTLIELLVVISIVSLLLAILLPALSAARQRGRSTACLCNLRGLAQAVLMYADNQDGRLPTGGLSHGGSGNEGASWLYAASAEIGNEALARCPSDESPHWTMPLPGGDRLRRMSYANNYYLMGVIENREEFNSLTRVPRPAVTIFWVELAEQGDFAASDHVHPETWFANPWGLALREVQIERHLKKANYAFLDGHAEPQSFENVYSINLSASHFPEIAWNHNKFDPVLGW